MHYFVPVTWAQYENVSVGTAANGVTAGAPGKLLVELSRELPSRLSLRGKRSHHARPLYGDPASTRQHV
jgi:hypothetical protein